MVDQSFYNFIRGGLEAALMGGIATTAVALPLIFYVRHSNRRENSEIDKAKSGLYKSLDRIPAEYRGDVAGVLRTLKEIPDPKKNATIDDVLDRYKM
ncbi:hypothetical protein HYX14_05560 [Candidatus Woesearchaeota archaeon]|nr:hypothetical protein [Candidatus Woesearchaeota archaeon]